MELLFRITMEAEAERKRWSEKFQQAAKALNEECSISANVELGIARDRMIAANNYCDGLHTAISAIGAWCDYHQYKAAVKEKIQ